MYEADFFSALYHSNAEGNMYWSAFLQAFEETRDEYLKKEYPKLCTDFWDGKLRSRSLEIDNIQAVFPGEKLQITMQLEEKSSGKVAVFSEIKRGNALVATVLEDLYPLDLVDDRKVKKEITDHFFSISFFVSRSSTAEQRRVRSTEYAHWIGRSREEFITNALPNVIQMLDDGLLVITSSTAIDIVDDAYLGDQVEVHICVSKITLARCFLRLEFFQKETGDLLAVANQKLGFARLKNDKTKICRVPMEFAKVGAEYSCSKVNRSLSRLARLVTNKK